MADWSIWRALEEWRSKRHELDPIFARAGIAPELETMVNRVCVDLKRTPPTAPLVSGDPSRDGQELSRYHEGYYRHYDEPLYKVESLLRQPWVPEAAPQAALIQQEVARLRQQMKANPGKNPGFGTLEQLLQHYVLLDSPQHPVDAAVLQERRNQLIDLAGYPLLVQHALSDPYNDQVPPLASAEFRRQLAQKMEEYSATPWLHCRVVTNWYVTLALDAALSSKKRDAEDDVRIRVQLRRRWPSLSVLLPKFEQADQIWYLLLICGALFAIFTEIWWLAVALIIWLNLSLGGHRRERKLIERRRAHLVERAQVMKKVRDRFVQGQTSLEKLTFTLRQLDEHDEYFDPVVYTLLHLHQHEV
ncbi:hypothetical protein [Chitinilyticum litopenaei]|uniref:hypothetical protein n=1 Tax=Chitinilyticum litopenaei TaxID=1121276 RepID=UPI000403D867|nr:hypothetical protein [Chitinilyticum litopenaei]